MRSQPSMIVQCAAELVDAASVLQASTCTPPTTHQPAAVELRARNSVQ